MTSMQVKGGLWGFVWVSAAGTLLHFAYQWTGCAPWVRAFCPVNESIWEHLKLLYWPMLLWTVLEWNLQGYGRHFLWSRSVGCLLGLLTVVIAYYTYTGVIGRGFLWADIALFFLGTAAAFGSSLYLQTKIQPVGRTECTLWLCGLLLIGFLFFRWTAAPPQINLFRDPVTGGYGIKEHPFKK